MASSLSADAPVNRPAVIGSAAEAASSTGVAPPPLPAGSWSQWTNKRKQPPWWPDGSPATHLKALVGWKQVARLYAVAHKAIFGSTALLDALEQVMVPATGTDGEDGGCEESLYGQLVSPVS